MAKLTNGVREMLPKNKQTKKKTLKNNNNQDWCSNKSWALYSISFYGCGGRQQRPQFNNSLVIFFTMSM